MIWEKYLQIFFPYQKIFVSLHSLSNKELPHSSSGPGHLPLTQKIISSTLICGTKPPQKGGFLF